MFNGFVDIVSYSEEAVNMSMISGHFSVSACCTSFVILC
jgi:hypothetical protein